MNDPVPAEADVPKPSTESWEDLSELVQKGDAEVAQGYLESLPEGEAGRALTHLDEDRQTELLKLLTPEDAASLLEEIPDPQAAQLLSQLSAQQAAPIVEELSSNQQADLVSQLDEEETEAILGEMSPESAKELRELIRYDPDTAGGLMITEYLSFHEFLDTDDVLDDMRDYAEEYAHYDVQYGYVVDAEEKLTGVLPMRKLLLSRRRTPLRGIMIRSPIMTLTTSTLDELRDLFERHSFLAVPVCTPENQLVGIVRRRDVEAALTQRANQTFLRFAGILGGEELRSMKLSVRSGRRLSWLTLNIVLNVIAASVIAVYEETLASVIALAVFLPIVSDMSGCSGSQAVAVSMRELTLRLIRPRDFWYVMRNELSVGLLNGVVLGLMLGVLGWIWKGIPALGLVVGVALALNTLVAVCFGSLIPLFLKALGFDPALASAPILTTITDMCGFFFVLSLASMMLPYLK